MGEMIFNTLGMIFAGNLTSEVASFVSSIINALQALMSDNGIATLLGVFTGIAGALITIFLFVDLMDKASKDMITLERLVLTFVKFFLAFVIVIYLKEILVTLFKLAMGFYGMLEKSSLKDQSSISMEYFPDDGNSDPSKWPKYSDVKDAIEGTGLKKASALTKNIGLFVQLLLPMALIWVAKVAAFFITASNAVMLVVRTIFAPIGVVQCFDEGQRSSGIRYIKKFVAEATTFAVILGILYAASKIQNALLANIISEAPYNGVLSVDNMYDAIKNSTVIIIIVLQLASVGGMFKAGQLANDIIGV